MRKKEPVGVAVDHFQVRGMASAESFYACLKLVAPAMSANERLLHVCTALLDLQVQFLTLHAPDDAPSTPAGLQQFLANVATLYWSEDI
jgi:hypothetical protein